MCCDHAQPVARNGSPGPVWQMDVLDERYVRCVSFVEHTEEDWSKSWVKSVNNAESSSLDSWMPGWRVLALISDTITVLCRSRVTSQSLDQGHVHGELDNMLGAQVWEFHGKGLLTGRLQSDEASTRGMTQMRWWQRGTLFELLGWF